MGAATGLRVLFIGPVPLTGRGSRPDSMGEHIVTTLTALGVEVEYSAYRERYFGPLNVNRWFEIARTDLALIRETPADRAVLRSIRRNPPDLILTLLGSYTPPALIELIREATTAPLVCWCQDHLGTLGRQYIFPARFDHVFAKDMQLIDLLTTATQRTRVHYLAEACNPAVHTPDGLSDAALDTHRCDVATAGTLYYYRAETLEALMEHDLALWGRVPRYYRGPLLARHRRRSIYNSEKAACFRAARIVLNTLHPQESAGLNARAFEIAGCGGFQLITQSNAVHLHFAPDREIVTYGSIEDLREKVRYWLDRDQQRREIADAAMQRARREHTYAHRLTELIDTVFP